MCYRIIYFLKLNLSVCADACVRACVSVCYTNPQFLTDLDQNWYEASLGAGAKQGQVGFAGRPPGGMYQTLEPGKPKSTYMLCI